MGPNPERPLNPLLLLLSCGRPTVSLAPTPPRFLTNRQLGGELPDQATTSRLHGVRMPRLAMSPAPSTVASLLPTLTGGRFDSTAGAGMSAAIAALEGERAEAGIHGLTRSQWTSETEGCEEPRVLLDLEHEGASWTATLGVPPSMWLTEPPSPDLAALSEACTLALSASSGDIELAACEEAEALAHFPEGSDCRACLEEDGDHARCLEERRCAEAAVRMTNAQGPWRHVYRAQGLLCAPNRVGEVYFLADELPETPAEPFQHGAFSAWCVEVWNESQAETTLMCSSQDGPGMGWSDILLSRLVDLAREGEGGQPHTGRVSLLASIEVDGQSFPYSAIYASGVTAVSAPVGSADDAWGIHPFDLRPGGTDPERIEDTMARDYIAALVLKTATTINGVVVQPFHKNRCADDGWTGPHADGSYDCPRPGAWSTDGTYDDAAIVFYDSRSIYAFPLLTLVSTGLPDPGVPGGFAPRILGSSTLADPDWEGCTWPETFVPDRVRLWDDQPADGGEPYASFDGQTWRFGKDGPDGVVMGLLTNQGRDFCP